MNHLDRMALMVRCGQFGTQAGILGLNKPIGSEKHAADPLPEGRLQRFLDEQLDEGHYALGMKLPAEREFAARFALSRGSVRRIIADYVARGLLRREAGSGTYVAALPHLARRERLHKAAILNVSPAELMEARLLFEPLLAGLIVRHATREDFDRMAHCLQEGERADSFEAFEYWDGALHEALSAATHNAFFMLCLRNMSEARENGEWGRLKQQALTAARRRRYEAQHRKLVAALRARDEATATALIREHLEEVRHNLFGG